MDTLFRKKTVFVLGKMALLLIAVATLGYGGAIISYSLTGESLWPVILTVATSGILLALLGASVVAGWLLSTSHRENPTEVPSGDTTQPITGSNPTP